MVLRKKLLLWLFMPALFGQQPVAHQHSFDADSQQLGTVSFPTSCRPGVRKPFERGIALLHSFGYDAARAQFKEIEARDPACAIAYWGDAMTIFHQLWDRPSKSDLQRGFALIQEARQKVAKTERERGYIQAAAAFYVDDEGATYETRTAAYSQALQRLRTQFPQDDEASVFYALSLLASPHAGDNDFADRKKGVVILNTVLASHPDHPGVSHYLIHACDNPEMARDGLPAARRYARIAPASAHALHMPSHIYARLGLWQDDIQSNLVSKAAAEEQHQARERLHAMDFLEYAYLQLGDFDRAKAIETEALKTKSQEFTKDSTDFFFYVQVHFPALYLMETKDWKAAYSLNFPKGASPDFQAVVYWVKAIAAAHLRDVAAAEQAVQNYDRALDAVRRGSYAYVAGQMENSRDEAHAWLEFAQSHAAEASRLLSLAADRQDRTGKGEVEIPAREMFADLLLELNRPQEALTQYRLSLKNNPSRYNGLHGTSRALELIR